MNVISPGPVDTPIFDRMGMPGEIADAVLYLSSHESRFIIGTDLVIDGGRIQL